MESTINSNLLGFGATGWGDDLLFAAATTLQLAVVSLGIALVLGFALAGAKLSKWRLLRYVAEAYTLFIRGVPEFLIILLVFFGSESILNTVAASLGYDAGIEVPKFAAAAAGLSLIFAAYACEIFRGAYLAVNAGQIEAAHAIGMKDWQVFIRVRFPPTLAFRYSWVW